MSWVLPDWPGAANDAVLKVAIVGAESTGKSTLLIALQQRLSQHGCAVAAVGETLRHWCLEQQRLPRADEQSELAAQHARALIAAAEGLAKQPTRPAILLADTTPLCTALYSQMHFDDHDGIESGLHFDAHWDLRLLMGLDLPWVADKPWRDGVEAQQRFDALLRAAYARGALAHQAIYGQAQSRCDAAWTAVMHAMQTAQSPPRPTAAWHSRCDRCSDPNCEWALFSALGKRAQTHLSARPRI